MTDQQVVNTFEAVARVVETLNRAIDLHEEWMRAIESDVEALSNRIEALTQATRHVQRLPSERT